MYSIINNRIFWPAKCTPPTNGHIIVAVPVNETEYTFVRDVSKLKVEGAMWGHGLSYDATIECERRSHQPGWPEPLQPVWTIYDMHSKNVLNDVYQDKTAALYRITCLRATGQHCKLQAAYGVIVGGMIHLVRRRPLPVITQTLEAFYEVKNGATY